MTWPQQPLVGFALVTLALSAACTQPPVPRDEPLEDPHAEVLAPIWEFTESHGDEGTLRVVEFSDFACPFCARFYADSHDLLYRDFIATGKVSWTFVPISFVRGASSELAAVASMCANEEQGFPRMKTILYDRQRE